MVAPVTNPTLAERGNASASSTQPAVTCSTAAENGDITSSAAFWSHALVNQSAASAAGRRAARHEAEVSRTRRGDHATFGDFGQVLHDVLRGFPFVRQRTAERGHEFGERRRSRHGPRLERLQERDGAPLGRRQRARHTVRVILAVHGSSVSSGCILAFRSGRR